MISEVQIELFKRFKSESFVLKPEGVTFLAGGNNSGKSTLLHALTVWDYCRSVVEQEKDREALSAGAKVSGIGIRAEDFSTLALPDLRHLWHNLQPNGDGKAPSYNMKLRCAWSDSATSSTPSGANNLLYLEFALLLSGDRLYLKPTDSNLRNDSSIPRIAYLPTFAGITPVEERLALAMRKRLIGRGAPGAVLRNMLYDLWQDNQEKREKLKSSAGRIPARDLALLRRTDPWEQLLTTVQDVFNISLTVNEFNEALHTRLRIGLYEGQLVDKRFKKNRGNAERDVMVEGSGFLQWLSVYALAVRDDLEVLLLDEPDAHLHPSLQGYLTDRLRRLAIDRGKQVLLATHSTTILGEAKPEDIFRVEKDGYLTKDEERVALFIGLGSQYAPRLDQLKRHRRLLLHDGPSNIEILKSLARQLGIRWPTNLVAWKYADDPKARKSLFAELLLDIPELKCLSLHDRDNHNVAAVKQDLTFFSAEPFKDGLGLRMWRRRNIESYLMCPAAIARAANCPESDINQFLQEHDLAVSPGVNWTRSDCSNTLLSTDCKKILLTGGENTVNRKFGVRPEHIAAVMLPNEIPDDIKTFLYELESICSSIS